MSNKSRNMAQMREASRPAEDVEQTPAPEATQAPAAETAVQENQAAPTPAPAEEVVENAAPLNTESKPEPEDKPAEPVAPVSDLERLTKEAALSSIPQLPVLAGALKNYYEKMKPGVVTSPALIASQNAQLWHAIRITLKSTDAFRQGIRLIMAYFRAGADGAFKDVMLLRGIEDVDHNRMARHVRHAYTNVMTLLTTAAGLENVKQTTRLIDLKRCLSVTDLTEPEKTRLVAFFS